MRTGKDTNGNPLFTYEYLLASTQIASFFSRLASKKSLANEDEVVMDDLSVAALKAGLTHPIIYDVYNLCDMSISQLRDICKSYDIDVNEVKVKRKLPYIEHITNLCKECTCQKKDS